MPTTDEATLAALFAHDEPGPRFSRKHLVGALRATGLPETTATARVNNALKRRHIHLRDSPGTHSRYAAADMAAMLMLSALLDFGVDDQEVIGRAAVPLYASAGGSNAAATARIQERNARMQRFSGHPAGWALAGVAAGEPWQFDVQVWRNLQTGKRRVLADVRRSDLPSHWQLDPQSEDWSPVAGLVSVLDHQLAPAVRLMSPFSGH